MGISMAKIGISIAVVGVGIGAGSDKDVFRPSRVPLLLYGALSIVYSGGVGKLALLRQLRMRCSRYITLIIFRH